MSLRISDVPPPPSELASGDPVSPSSEPVSPTQATVSPILATVTRAWTPVIPIRNVDVRPWLAEGSREAAQLAAIGFVKGLSVPETLKSQPTYTDKKYAIVTLLDVVDDHPDAPWAKTVLDGDFGKRAPLVVKEIDEATSADLDLVNARNERAKNYGPTYEAYLSFKHVVRTSLGPASKEYRSIHIRSNGTIEDDPTEPNQPTPPVNPPVNPPVTPNP